MKKSAFMFVAAISMASCCCNNGTANGECSSEACAETEEVAADTTVIVDATVEIVAE